MMEFTIDEILDTALFSFTEDNDEFQDFKFRII